MARILKFPGVPGLPAPGEDGPRREGDQRKPPKFGFTRVRRRKREEPEDQLDLFSRGLVVAFPGGISPFEEALVRDEAGDADTARALYLQAISAGDCAADANCNLGILEYGAGHTDVAFDCFRQALTQDQRHWESHYNLGNLYFDAGQHGPARVHYEVAAQIAPDFRNVFFNLGLVLALQADYGPSIDALERYRDLAPEEEAEAADELIDTLRASRAHAEGRSTKID